MANKIKGGPDTEAQAASVGAKSKNLTLTFSGEAELALYDALQKAAEEDDRPLSRFVIRKLKAAANGASPVQ